MLFRLPCIVALSIVACLSPQSIAQVFDTPDAAKADPDFLIQGEYVGDNKAMQVIARGDGEFDVVVFELGLPGAGWNKSEVRRIDGDADLVTELTESMKLKRVERQSPTLAAAPPADAVVLFDGSEQSLRDHWSSGAKRTDDSLLIPGVTSKDTFTDYRLHLEFRLPFMPKATGQARGNSGVYHQGRYETQILDSFGLEGKDNETGGIYEIRAPDLNMCFPPLVWQTYDVEYTAARFDDAGNKLSAARITAAVNGVPVQTAVEVPRTTRAAPQKESAEPGPIYLQDHGNPVRFRNIWIVPRDLAKESRRPIVSGYERLFADSDPRHFGGRMLIETLGCQSCHSGSLSPGTPGERVGVRGQGPNLDNVADRVRVDHLVRFIASPRDTKPGTTMPDPWHGLSDDKRQSSALAIANYLVAGKSLPLDQVSDSASVERGKLLYHQQGCVACHAAIEDTNDAVNSVPLGDVVKKYTLGSLSKFLLDPVAVRPCGRMPKVVANAIEARDIASYLLRDVVIVPGAEMITRRVYKGRWQKLPDFASLKPHRESQVDGLKIDDIKGQFAASFNAFFQITEPGQYTFHLKCDDGASLLVNGEVLINHDGIHPASEKSKRMRLDAGVYPLQMLYFEGGGERVLELEVESESVGRIPISSLVCANVGGVAKSLLPTNFQANKALVAQGEQLFVSAGCIRCHAKSSLSSSSTVRAKALADCRAEVGCLATEVPAGLPNYELTTRQRQRIEAALKLIDAPLTDPAESVLYTMAALNCYACHVRDQVGGPDAIRNASFTTKTPEMGDEGRLPPNLSNVGDKLTDDYLKSILAAGADERPYMRTRMPGFGNAIESDFVAALISLDRRDDGHDGKSVSTPIENLITDGRTLCGNDGLSCIKCHTFGGVGLPGIQAIDMLRMTTRLRRDWFERYLLHPQTYRPGTRMPASFLDGKSVVAKVAEGRPADQIEAMWRYLLLDKDAKTPSGLLIDAIELKDPERPIIYRNFFTGVSPRGIGVGYPEAVNVIWDAQRMSLAFVWKNSFIDAAKHWTGRGNGTQEPLGDAVVKLDAETPVAVLAEPNAEWQYAANDKVHFLGYALDKVGRPTFRYCVGEVIVADKIEPEIGPASIPVLNREFQLIGQGEATVLIAKGEIKAERDGWYRVDGRYRVRVAGGNTRPISFGEQAELRVNVQLDAVKPVSIQTQISW